MKLNDNLLSGFLDAELPEAQMQEIRDLLVEDEQLVERLAELAMVDQWVALHAAQIDQKPIPAELNQLLTKASEKQKSNVIEISLWRKINVTATRHAALAAGVAIFFAIGVNNWMKSEPLYDNNVVPSQIAKVLNTYISGQTIASSNGIEVKPYFSFENQQGQYCRHYQVKQTDNVTENIACRAEKDWLLVASIKTENTDISGQYQAASGQTQVDKIIDKMSKGPVFDLTQENTAIAQEWQTTLKLNKR